MPHLVSCNWPLPIQRRRILDGPRDMCTGRELKSKFLYKDMILIIVVVVVVVMIASRETFC